MDKKDLNHLWEVAMDAVVWAGDAIELDKAGFKHGYKKGAVERKLKDAQKAVIIIDKELT